MTVEEELLEIGEILVEMAEHHTITADTDRRKGCFHPSSINKCLRYQMYEYQGAPSATIPARRIEQGIQFDALAAEWANRLTDIGYEVSTQQPLPIAGDFHGLAGTCDIYLPQLPALIEVKHTNMARMKRVKEKGLMEDGWWWQVQCYLWMAQCNHGLVLMEAVDFFGRLHYHLHPIDVDHDAITSIRNRLIILNRYLDQDEMPPGDCSPPQDCPYFKVCYGGERGDRKWVC